MSTDGGFSAELQALVQQAQNWEDQASQMGKLATQVAQVNYAVPGYSIFAPAVGVYTQGCERVAQLCSEGQAEMESIAGALITAAGRYGYTDQMASNSARAVGNEIKSFANEIAGSGQAANTENKTVNIIDQVINVRR